MNSQKLSNLELWCLLMRPLRDRATLPVIEYFAKSLKVTQGHSK